MFSLEKAPNPSVHQARGFHLVHIRVIPFLTRLSELTAVFHENQEQKCLRQPGKGCHQKGILKSHIRDPRSKTIYQSRQFKDPRKALGMLNILPVSDPKTHRAPDQDDSDDGLAT